MTSTGISRLFPAVLAVIILALASVAPVAAAEADLAPLVQEFSNRKYDPKVEAIEKLGASGDMRAVAILKALGNRDLYTMKSGDRVVLARETADGMAISDPVTGEDLGTVPEKALQKIRLNNRMRRTISAAIGTLTLMSPDAAIRGDAAESIFLSRDDDDLEVLDAALAKETDPDVKLLMEQARAAIVLENGSPDEDLIAAIAVVKSRGDRDALSVLTGLANGEGPVAEAAKEAVTGIENRLELWGAAQNVFYGLSLGSVLLLAAIGLAITFGVMGVINMAHGEMIMIGAYVTFMVQELIRTSAPWLFDYSLFIALPLAFLIAGLIGMAIEHGVIRFLYGRPLETLLATWGISLILQQAVRTIFGPTNREVGTPDWMSGFFKLGELTLTYNRVYILFFSFAVLALLMLVMRYTAFGLQMRAVTQNRPMAGSMGIRTGWVDKLTFGLGSGIAGIAGVALSQIDNVSPNLGQSYIIDSFMVVVFGGVGNLWGTLVGAMTLGVANKFLEPYAGAVLAKIFVLVFIILFIQKRPRGLFALKGRAVEQ
ncbi:urea transport system permease protein [Rhodobium orientis]|uniref:Urea ABC transporter permease subunit UrtB n=1 Tax=Rhodobium orientis TaxID=34017 RepID=A0A327JQ13_9HYPH|nr:urea ABC transporter permease subunit UrtB [Rhodobium orientis]MBB4305415.1 urea transport system permease protein [Rhodobium orientis]MBK5948324.1 urea ABC transporter permease subunit UrtB [Rhodobium orientis]RAI25508.1 urea ABC transporter permease subunit UrtB [Rhodobium orientis]